MAKTEPSDQPKTGTIAVNGAVRQATTAVAKTVEPSGSTYTFASTVTITYRQHTLTFRDGAPYSLDAALLAYLGANNIAVVAA